MSNNATKVQKDTDERCPDCGSTSIIHDHHRGEVICKNCGAVIEESIIDDSPEWRAYSSEERAKRARVGAQTTYTRHDKGLSTQIGIEDRDAYGRKLSPQQRSQIYRLRKWQTRTRVNSATDRNLTQAMRELDRIASQLGLPQSVKETASVIYRKALNQRLIRGRSIEAMIAAATYAAARQRRVPRPLDEFAKHSRTSKKDIGRCYRLLINELNLKIPLTDPTSYVVRFGAELRLSGRVVKTARDIVDKAKRNRITIGKDPVGLAAAAIYLAGILEGEQRTQREIAETATVTEVTIRNRYKELVRSLGISFNT